MELTLVVGYLSADSCSHLIINPTGSQTYDFLIQLSNRYANKSSKVNYPKVYDIVFITGSCHCLKSKP